MTRIRKRQRARSTRTGDTVISQGLDGRNMAVNTVQGAFVSGQPTAEAAVLQQGSWMMCWCVENRIGKREEE
jgi:hypothetical protein